MMNRRLFIKKSTLGSLSLSLMPYGSSMFLHPEFEHLTILHTNDVHSRVEPFPMDGSRNQGQGGAARRASLIAKIRSQEKNVVLLDSGDMLQGTPYFNYFGGELEFKLMSEMQYDVATLGNHDFDGGMDGIHNQLQHADFDIVSANYDFSDTILHDHVADFKIIEKSGIRLGIFGIGIELDGLVPSELYLETKYNDPIEVSNRTAKHLKEEEKCDYVICLSHLGYKYRNGRISDVLFAEATSNIDLILGGHTHTFLSEPDIRTNISGEPVLINQAGWGGILLGRIDISFEKNRKNKCLSCRNIAIK